MSAPATDLDALHAGVVTGIRAAFPALATVEAYRADRTQLPVPACLIEIEDLEPEQDFDPGTEQLSATARFRAYLVMGFRTPNVEMEARKLAAAMMHLVHGNRWGASTGAARVLEAAPEEFVTDRDQYVVWAVAWEQDILIGDSVWTGGDVPQTVLASWVPDIGPPNEGKYRVISETPE